jgi:hypothetical protein
MAERATERPAVFGQAGRARWATVKIETERATYVGRLYVPETKKRLSDVIADDRPFLNMTDVSTNDAATTESFVAIAKRSILTVRVLKEVDAEVVPFRNRP